MLRHMRKTVISLLLASVSALRAGEPTEFRPGEVWLDSAGQAINAHGGGMLFHEGTYYWYGENKEGRTWLH